ncbi:D-alanine--D-alanine ligase [Anopheles sinensis]|uniref:D-alanine--D-alanine ligase n=1 Tax=Anopheles sinensis TaxID=74873 RepID=A0A084WRA8_ANOSI|nr:D-alanine--D-alanine ligase [Anopheles sinensis]
MAKQKGWEGKGAQKYAPETHIAHSASESSDETSIRNPFTERRRSVCVEIRHFIIFIRTFRDRPTDGFDVLRQRPCIMLSASLLRYAACPPCPIPVAPRFSPPPIDVLPFRASLPYILYPNNEGKNRFRFPTFCPPTRSTRLMSSTTTAKVDTCVK